jgi:hypothetical protein
MAMLRTFDLSTDFSQFFLGGLIILMLFAVLLTWVSPKGKKKRRGGGRVDDRTVSVDGDLID